MNGVRARRRLRLLAAAVLALLFPAPSIAAGPEWLPGFPVRTGSSVILMWTPVPQASEYILMRRTGSEEYRPVHRGPETFHEDRGAPLALPIAYKVVPVVGGAPGEPSAEKVLTPPKRPAPPSVIGAVATGGAVSLKWTVGPDTAFSKVFRAQKKEGPYDLVASGPFDTYTDRELESDKTYFYRFSAVSVHGVESPPSDPIAAGRLAAAAPVKAAPAPIRKVALLGQFSGEKYYPLDQPSEIALSPSGEIFVLDRKSVQVFDADGAYRRRIVFDKSWGPASGLLLDAKGNILLSFFADQALRRIDAEGKLVEEIRDPFCRKHDPTNPNDAAIDGAGNIWIVDGKRSRVIRASRSCDAFEVIRRDPPRPARKKGEELDFPAPKKIYFNRHDGRIYLVLGPRAEIVAIDPASKKVIGTFGGAGAGPDKFSGIGGLCFTSNGHIFVLDQFRQVIQEFDGAFQHVATYADVVEKKGARLSLNLATTLACREDLKRFYVTSNLGGRVYVYQVAD